MVASIRACVSECSLLRMADVTGETRRERKFKG